MTFDLYRAVERMVAHHPDMINIQKVEDGYTPLHVAVANNQPAVAEFLSQQVCVCVCVCERACVRV